MWLLLSQVTSVFAQADLPFPYDTVGEQECVTVDGVLSCAARDQDPPVMILIAVGFWVLGVVLCLYAGRDMERRGQSGALWGAVVLFGGWFGVGVWWLARKRIPLLPKAPPAPESPYGPGVRPGSLPWS